MCGRYVLIPNKQVAKTFEIAEPQMKLVETTPNFNIGPGFIEPVVVRHSPNSLELMKWGLIPPWAKDIKIGFKMINARAETLISKISFRKPFKSQRCLVPANGFYEWKQTNSGKIPYYISIKEQPVFGMAGLYEIAHDGDGREIKSFTIITTTPNVLMAEIHDRMPAILNPADYDYWLDNSKYEEHKLLSLLLPFAGEMEMHPVSTKVNKLENQEKELIYPI